MNIITKKSPDRTKLVRALSFAFFIPFVPYFTYFLYARNSIAGLLLLILWPVFLYLVIVGLLYAVVLVDYVFSAYSKPPQKIISALVIISLMALLIWQVIPRLLYQG